MTDNGSGRIVDDLFDALARGDLAAARDCFTPDAVIWHGFDRIGHDLDGIVRDWEQLVANFPSRAFVDVRRQATADGLVQQQLMVVTTAAGKRMAWPVCMVIRIEDGRIARLDEYIDRAGSFEPAVDDPVTPGLAPPAGPADREVRIFRAKDAPGLVESRCMKMEEITEVQRNGLRALVEAGYLHGDDIRILADIPGFSLTHAWLKKDYPLILHSHDSDCLYYVASGSLHFGTTDLGPRDCFFVPAGVPYTYRPGPEGVEVLEVRHVGKFNFVNMSKSAAYWEKAAETVAANVEGWKVAERPPLNA